MAEDITGNHVPVKPAASASTSHSTRAASRPPIAPVVSLDVMNIESAVLLNLNGTSQVGVVVGVSVTVGVGVIVAVCVTVGV